MTYEWFEARREHLQSIQSKAQSDADNVFVCPVTNKRFQSEGTYESHTRTKKYREALRKAGLSEPPPPKVVMKQRGAGQQAGPQGASDGGWAPGARGRGDDDDAASTSGSASGWETDDDTKEVRTCSAATRRAHARGSAPDIVPRGLREYGDASYRQTLYARATG